MIPVIVTFIPEGTQFFYAHRIHVERHDCSGMIISELRSIRGSDVNLSGQTLLLSICIQLAEVMIEALVFLQHINDVIDRLYTARSLRVLLICGRARSSSDAASY